MKRPSVCEVAAKSPAPDGLEVMGDAAKASEAVVGHDSAPTLKDLPVRESTLTPALEKFRRARTRSRWGFKD